MQRGKRKYEKMKKLYNVDVRRLPKMENKKEGGQPLASSSHGAVERCCSDSELNGRGCPACVSMRAGDWLTLRKLGRSSQMNAGRV